MKSFRRNLRVWVAAWLVIQAASLSALVPRDCCAADRPTMSGTERGCHDDTAATLCPMRALDGTPCPMHRGGHHESDDKPSTRCSMRGTCDGPMAALLSLLGNHGILTDSLAVLPDLHASPITVDTRESLISRFASPDPPPPRA